LDGEEVIGFARHIGLAVDRGECHTKGVGVGLAAARPRFEQYCVRIELRAQADRGRLFLAEPVELHHLGA
jgi:hypothetical protein